MRIKDLDAQWLLRKHFFGIYKVVDAENNIVPDSVDYSVEGRRLVMINPNNERDFFPESVIEEEIQAAIAELEGSLGVAIRNHEREIEFHDYIRDDAMNYFTVKPRKYPVTKVHSLSLQYGEQGQEIYTFPSEYVQIKPNTFSSMVQILPKISGLSFLRGTNQLNYFSWFTSITSGTGDRIPSLIRLEYDAGLEGRPAEIDQDLIKAIGMLASIPLLNIWGDIIIAPGVANFSTSFDGISTSVGTTLSAENSAFSARILMYNRALHGQSIQGEPGLLATLKKKYQRVVLGML